MRVLTMYEPEDFATDGVLVEESLRETLYRLDEAYWGLRPLSREEAKRTFEWLASRAHFDRDSLFEPTEYDKQRLAGHRDPETGKWVRVGLKGLTGERGGGPGGAVLRTAMRMPDVLPDFAEKLRKYFIYMEPGPKGPRFGPGSERILERGMYCCQPCTIPYEASLRRAAPGLYRRQEAKFIAHLKSWRERGGGTRWYRAPFYYTVLALHDIGSKATREELRCVADRVRPSIATKWKAENRASRAKARAAEILLTYKP